MGCKYESNAQELRLTESNFHVACQTKTFLKIHLYVAILGHTWYTCMTRNIIIVHPRISILFHILLLYAQEFLLTVQEHP